MVVYYYKHGRSDAISILDQYQPGCWVYAETPTSDELDMLTKTLHLDRGQMDDALDDDEIPRLEQQDGITYMFIRFAYATDSGELKTAPLLCAIGKDLFVTISSRPMQRFQHFTSGKIDVTTSHHVRLMLAIVEQVIDQYETYINDMSRQIQTIRTRFRSHRVLNQDFVNFVLIEDELNDFMSALLPTTAILRRLLLGRHIPLSANEQAIVNDLMLNNEQSVEECRSNVRSIVSIRDAYASIASNNLNQTMKVLTVATLLIALPNVFFGMYGMNIALPFQDEIWAYLFVLGLSLSATAVLIVLARAKKIL